MKYLVKNKHWNIVEDYNLDKLLYLLIDRPEADPVYNVYIWINENKEYHRDYDLPAVFWSVGDAIWCKNHEYHRNYNSPADLRNNGCKKYYVNGEFIKEENSK